MPAAATTSLIDEVAVHIRSYLAGLSRRPVRPELDVADVRALLPGALTDEGADGEGVIRQLADLGRQATVATAGPRYFGFVTGGTLPTALAAELLTVAWDQNAAMAVMSPLASVAEETAGRWIIELLGLPETAAIGFVTGGQSANTTSLAVARHYVLAKHGWDVEQHGLQGAPRVTVVVGQARHATVDAASRVVGLGVPALVVDADDEGRMIPEALARATRGIDGPVIVCAQAGNVVTGAFDPFGPIIDIAQGLGAWVHVDGAFGGWAAASARRRHLTAGMERADSWAVDGHKLLNVPFDCGYAITARPADHRATCTSTASYYVTDGEAQPRDGMTWVLDASRRARGIATYAALRALGRHGVADLVDRCCANARLLAEQLRGADGVEVVNEVVFNQVVLRFDRDDATTNAVIAELQRDGTCWAGGANWRGSAVMRWSVANWSTTADDIHASARAVREALAKVRAGR